MAVNTDPNYKSGSNKSSWNTSVYSIVPTDNIWGSEGIEILNPLYINDPFGFSDKAKIDLINNLSNLNKHKTLILYGYGNPSTTINKHFSDSHPSFETGDELWWGYKPRIDDYAEGFHYDHSGAGKELGQILVDVEGLLYSLDGVTIKELAENRSNNFGITQTNYSNILYIDLEGTDETGGSAYKNGLIRVYRISSPGVTTKTIYHPNVVYTYPDVRDVQDATHVDWLGNVITDPDWLNSIYFNRTPTAINENQNEITESTVIYTEPVWEFNSGFYLKSLSILDENDNNKLTKLSGVPENMVFEDENGNQIKLLVNKIYANQIDVTTLNQLQITDKEVLVQSENTEAGNGLYSVNRIDDDNVSLKYTKNIDRFELRDNGDDLLKLKCDKVLINGQEDLEYDDDVVITNQTEFDAVFDGTEFKVTHPVAHYSSGDDQDFDFPYNNVYSLSEILPIGFITNNRIDLRFGDMEWYAFGASNTNESWFDQATVGHNYGSVYFDPAAVAWSSFLDGTTYNGMQSITLSKSVDNDKLGGSFNFYYHESAWRYAFETTTNHVYIAQNGSVYEGNNVGDNDYLVVRWDGVVGNAGILGGNSVVDIPKYSVEYRKIRINSGDYILNNDIDIQINSMNIHCMKGAVIDLSNGVNVKNSSLSDIRDIKLELNVEDSGTGLIDILDLTNIIQSEIDLNVNNTITTNIIKGGLNNKINLVVNNSSIENNLFEVSNSYITGSLETDNTGDKIFNNCTKLVLMCTIDGSRIMGADNYDF